MRLLAAPSACGKAGSLLWEWGALESGQLDALLDLGEDLWRVVVDARLVVGEVGQAVGVDDRVWPVRLAVSAQALSEFQQATHPLLYYGLRTVTGH
jgi:hypothetical protein